MARNTTVFVEIISTEFKDWEKVYRAGILQIHCCKTDCKYHNGARDNYNPCEIARSVAPLIALREVQGIDVVDDCEAYSPKVGVQQWKMRISSLNNN